MYVFPDFGLVIFGVGGFQLFRDLCAFLATEVHPLIGDLSCRGPVSAMSAAASLDAPERVCFCLTLCSGQCFLPANLMWII